MRFIVFRRFFPSLTDKMMPVNMMSCSIEEELDIVDDFDDFDNMLPVKEISCIPKV